MVPLAFFSLGFLVGNLVGLTDSSVVTSLLPMLFAFGGGTSIAFLKKIPRKERKIAACAVLAFSISCLFGTYLGIFIAENQLLTLGKTDKILKENEIAKDLFKIVFHVESGKINSKQAFESLKQLIDTSKKNNFGNKYLRKNIQNRLESIEDLLSQNLIDYKQAYNDLVSHIVEEYEKKNK